MCLVLAGCGGGAEGLWICVDSATPVDPTDQLELAVAVSIASGRPYCDPARRTVAAPLELPYCVGIEPASSGDHLAVLRAELWSASRAQLRARVATQRGVTLETAARHTVLLDARCSAAADTACDSSEQCVAAECQEIGFADPTAANAADDPGLVAGYAPCRDGL